MQEFEPKRKNKILTKEFLAKNAYVLVLAVLLLGGITYGYTFFIQNKKIASGSITTAALTINYTDLSINATGLSVPTDDNEGMSEYSKSLTISNPTTIDGKINLTLNRTSGLALTDMRYALIVNGAIQEIDDVPSDGKILSTAVMGNESVNVELRLWPKTTYSGSETTFVGELTPEIKYLGSKATTSISSPAGKYVNFNCSSTCEVWQIVKVEDNRLVLTRQADYTNATSRTNSNRYNPTGLFNDDSLITSLSTDEKNVYLAKTVKIDGGSGTQADPYTLVNNDFREGDKKITAVITYKHNGVTVGTQNVYYNQTNYISKTYTENGFRGWTDGTNDYEFFDSVSFTSDIDLTSKGVVSIGDNVYFSLTEAIAAVPDTNTETIVNVNDDIVEYPITIDTNKDVKLRLNGHTLSYNDNASASSLATVKGKMTLDGSGTITSNIQKPLFFPTSTGTLIVSGTTIDTSASDAVLNYGTMVVNSGSISSAASYTLYNRGDLTINGGTMSNTSSIGTIYSYEGTLTINDGTISNTGTKYAVGIGTNSTATISGGAISSIAQEAVVNVGTTEISGGTLSSTNSNPISNEGTMTIDDGFSITSDTIKPIINNKSTGDLTIAGGSISSSATNTIGNAGTLTVTGGTVSATSTSGYAAIRNTGTLFVSGGTISGNGGSGIWNISAASATISGGSLSSTSGNPISNEGTMTINNGFTISSSTSKNVINNKSTGNLTIAGGSMTSSATNTIANAGTMTVSGGSIYATSTSGYASIRNAGTLTLTGGTLSANGGPNVWNVADASATISGGSLTTTNGNPITNEGIMTINTGFTISSSTTKPIINNKSTGNLTIAGGNLSSSGTTTINNAGTITVTGGTVEATSSELYSSIKNMGTLSVAGGTLSSNGGPTIYNSAGATSTLSGGTVVSVEDSGVENYGELTIAAGFNMTVTAEDYPYISNDDDGVVNITGGSITAGNIPIIFNYGTVSMTGGTLTANTASFATIYSYGTLTIDGGTVINNSASGNAAYNNNGTATFISGTCTPRNF